jgi:predicted DNA-binding transcriptional regulator YafY
MTDDGRLDHFSLRTRQRFVFFEQRVYWEGRVSRADLMRRFAISTAQASVDIAEYREAAPENVTYDPSSKEYVATAAFAPRFFAPDARQYLTQLLLMADHALAPSESWIGAVPEHDAVPRVRRKLPAETLRPIVLAIRRNRAIEIEYQSFSSADPEVRLIAPHALFFDGFRWHARAWCFRRSNFVDFVLGRVLRVGETKPSNVPSALDAAWQKMVTVRLGANSQLSEGQRRALELDYGMTDGVIDVPMRLSTVYYFIRHFALDLDEEALPATRRHVVWLNRDEITALQHAMGSNDQIAGERTALSA